MSLMVSADLRFLFLFVTGDEFPDTDEDVLRALANVWDQAGRRLRDGLGPEVRRALALIGATFQGEAEQAFVARMAPFVLGKDNYIDSSAMFFFAVAAMLRELALDVEYLKYVVVLELATLQSDFAWAFVAGSVLGPLILEWLIGRVAMTRSALETLLEWFNLRLGTMGEKAAIGQELLLGMTSSIGNQMLITVAAQKIEIDKGTRTAWNGEYLGDAAVVGAVGSVLLPPALELGRRVAKGTRSVVELLDAAFRKAEGKKDWHQGFAVGVAHVFRESIHEGATGTVSNAILTQQLSLNWADFTGGASSGVARVSGHLLGHTARTLAITATAAIKGSADTGPSRTGKPDPGTGTGTGTGTGKSDIFLDEKPGTAAPLLPYIEGATGVDGSGQGPGLGLGETGPPPAYGVSTGDAGSISNGDLEKRAAAPEAEPASVVESLLPTTTPPEMAGERPRPRFDIAAVASGFPKTLLDDPVRRTMAENIVASTHDVGRLRSAGRYDHLLLAVAGTAGHSPVRARDLSLRAAYAWGTNLPPVAHGGAPGTSPGPAAVSWRSEDHTKTAEGGYKFSSWAPGFRKVAGRTDAGQLFAALDYQAGHQPGTPAGSTPSGSTVTSKAFSSQPPEEKDEKREHALFYRLFWSKLSVPSSRASLPGPAGPEPGQGAPSMPGRVGGLPVARSQGSPVARPGRGTGRKPVGSSRGHAWPAPVGVPRLARPVTGHPDTANTADTGTMVRLLGLTGDQADEARTLWQRHAGREEFSLARLRSMIHELRTADHADNPTTPRNSQETGVLGNGRALGLLRLSHKLGYIPSGWGAIATHVRGSGLQPHDLIDTAIHLRIDPAEIEVYLTSGQFPAPASTQTKTTTTTRTGTGTGMGRSVAEHVVAAYPGWALGVRRKLRLAASVSMQDVRNRLGARLTFTDLDTMTTEQAHQLAASWEHNPATRQPGTPASRPAFNSLNGGSTSRPSRSSPGKPSPLTIPNTPTNS